MWGSTLFLHRLYPEPGPGGENFGSGSSDCHMQTKKWKGLGLRVEAGHPPGRMRIVGFCFFEHLL